tara:strand:+ start:96 stop:314 length:219 start_codon:yes stop_codon:yes gene_type:complete
MKRVQGHSHLYRDEISGAIVNKNNSEYNQRLRNINQSNLEKSELNQMREDIDELKSLLKKLVNNNISNIKQT